MQGIVSYATYIPRFRLTSDTDNWSNNFERAVANFDEDPITMGVAASQLCVKNVDKTSVKALLFCSTSAPYAEKQNAAVIATALDLPTTTLTLDIGGSLRAGTSAISIAIDMLNNIDGLILVVASEARIALPRTSLNDSLGDGAAAVLLGSQDALATIDFKITQHSMTYDLWRQSNARFISQWEDRFISDNGLEMSLAQGISTTLNQAGITVSEIHKLAYNCSTIRQSQKIRAALKANTSQVNTDILEKIGNTGCAMPLMELCLALDQSNEEDQYICLAAYGDGVDVMIWKTTKICAPNKDSIFGVTSYINSAASLKSYEEYAKLKNLWVFGDTIRRPEQSPPSVPAIYREEDKNIRFLGGRCNTCHYIQYPMQRICVECQEETTYSPISLSASKAELYTYSMDYLAGTLDVPLIICTVNFTEGGRILCVMTDRLVEEIYVGMPLQMTFRKISEYNGITSYFWKASPIRIQEGDQHERN